MDKYHSISSCVLWEYMPGILCPDAQMNVKMKRLEGCQRVVLVLQDTLASGLLRSNPNAESIIAFNRDL